MTLNNILKQEYNNIKEREIIFIVRSFLFNKKIIRNENLVTENGNFRFEDYDNPLDFIKTEYFLKNNDSLSDEQFEYVSYIEEIISSVNESFNTIIKIYIKSYTDNGKIDIFLKKYNVKVPENNFHSSDIEEKELILFILSKKVLLQIAKDYQELLFKDINSKPLTILVSEYQNIVTNIMNSEKFKEKIINRKKKNTPIKEIEINLINKINKLISIEYFLNPSIIIDIEELFDIKLFSTGLEKICISLVDKKILSIEDLDLFFRNEKTHLLEKFHSIKF
jgi:hypothetical protein